MAIDRWNGNGDWTGNPTDWSSGSAPGSTDSAEIQTGTDTLSTSASLLAVTVDSASTLDLGADAALTTSQGFINVGVTSLATNGDQVSVGGTLTNSGTFTIGNTNLAASTTVTVGGLANTSTGYLVVQGNTGQNATSQATLAVTGSSPTTIAGSVRVLGDADLQLATAISSIGAGGFFQVDGAQARVTIGKTTTSAVANLSTNYGTANFDGFCDLGYGGTTITTDVSFSNYATLWVDMYGGDGGSTVTYGGYLLNTGLAIIGNTSLGGQSPNDLASTTVKATALDNTGTLYLEGNITAGTTNQATLNITGAATSTASGFLRVSGDADLEFKSGAMTTIGRGSNLELDGAQARISDGASKTSSALTTLSTNNGIFQLRGNNSLGAGGATVTTTTNFTNNDDLYVDQYGGDGGTTFTVGGTLTNANSVVIIGNGSLGADTTVTANSFANTGNFTLQGNTSGNSSDEALFNDKGAAISTVSGYVRIGGDADLAFKSGGFKTIGYGSTLELDGAQARVSTGVGTTSGALSGLYSNAGTLLIRGNTGFGAGGVSVKTTTSFKNNNTLDVDIYGGDGGSTLTIGGRLTTVETVSIGNGGLSAITTVSAAGLYNTGSFTLQGNTTSGTADEAVFACTVVATATVDGVLRIGGDADLEYKSGAITTVAYDASLELDGSGARVSYGAATTNTALRHLTSNAGTILLRGDSGYGSGGVTLATTADLTNTGDLYVDMYGGDGGTKLTIGGTLTNQGSGGQGGSGSQGAIVFGNGGTSAATTVTADALVNNGALTLQGSSSALTELVITTNATNTGTLTVDAATKLALTGSTSTFTENGGTATIAGTITAKTIDAEGGLLDFSTALTSTGALEIGAGGTMQFDGSASSSHTVTFTKSSGQLNLSAPASFTAHIAGFSGNDVIDLLDASVSTLSYSGTSTSGTLKLTLADNSVDYLRFNGDYTTASFGLASDGHGGTDILDPPASSPDHAAFTQALFEGAFAGSAVESMPTWHEPHGHAAPALVATDLHGRG